jgi:hypothetical protein
MNNQYVITGDLTKDSIFCLLNNINTKGFVWRGFTDKEKEMIPSAAFYAVNNGQAGIGKYKRCDTIQPVFIMGELERIGYHINNRNKLGEYPFEIPDELSEVVFSHTQGETSFLENLRDKYKIDFYPKSNLLLQAISYVQHYFGGTSLLDFTVNPLKALYFSIGKNGINLCDEKYLWNNNDSWLFGLSINIFQTHKNVISGNPKCKFDLYLPSYYKNTRIRNQEGIFIYQLYDMKYVCKGEEFNYMNILNFFEDEFNNNNELDLNEIEEKSKNNNFGGIDNNIGILYVLLKIPKKEKTYLKYYLNSMGIDDNFMMGIERAV